MKSCILDLGITIVVVYNTRFQHTDWQTFNLKARIKIMTGCVV